MRIRQIIFLLFLGLLVVTCSKDNSLTDDDDDNKDNTETDFFTITEGFEYGTKTAFSADSITLYTGLWYMDDALIAGQSKDAKNGSYSARLRSGNISMEFDIENVSMLYISHAAYGSDNYGTWQLLMSINQGESYEQIGKDIIESSTTLITDSFDITTTSSVRFKIVTESGSNSQRINIDDITFYGKGESGITPKVPEDQSNVSDDDDNNNGGNDNSDERSIETGSDAQPTSGDDNNLLLGNPSGAAAVSDSTTNYLINAAYYTESYNSERGTPNWVSWHIGSGDITNNVARQNNFAAWADMPNGWYKVGNTSFSGSGFDRGHNCPSADRTNSKEANSATFLMINMIPQAPTNNQKTWVSFENYLRDKVDEDNEIFVIMGAYGKGGTGTLGYKETIDNGKVTVPSNVWKVAVIMNKGNNDLSRINSGNATVIAINTPNKNDLNENWKHYLVSVDAIEEATGYDLLSKVDSSVQAALESTVYSE